MRDPFNINSPTCFSGARTRAALATLKRLGYTYHGGELWKPPLGHLPPWLDAAASPPHRGVAKVKPSR